MIAATLKELERISSAPPSMPSPARARRPFICTSDQWGVLLVGTVVSFIVAWFVIAWFMKWVQKHGFVPFAIYRLVAGAAFLALAFKGNS